MWIWINMIVQYHITPRVFSLKITCGILLVSVWSWGMATIHGRGERTSWDGEVALSGKNIDISSLYIKQKCLSVRLSVHYVWRGDGKGGGEMGRGFHRLNAWMEILFPRIAGSPSSCSVFHFLAVLKQKWSYDILVVKLLWNQNTKIINAVLKLEDGMHYALDFCKKKYHFRTTDSV